MQVNFDVDGQVELGYDFNVSVLYGLKMKDGTIVILQPWDEAYTWGDDIPDEIIAQEYGGEISFERVDHNNMELYYSD